MTTERTLINIYGDVWVWSDEELSGTVTESTATPVPDCKISVQATANGINGEKEKQRDLSALQRESSMPDLLVETLAALEAANRFITNGLEYGYIDLAEEDTSGMHTIDAIRHAIRKSKGWMES